MLQLFFLKRNRWRKIESFWGKVFHYRLIETYIVNRKLKLRVAIKYLTAIIDLLESILSNSLLHITFNNSTVFSIYIYICSSTIASRVSDYCRIHTTWHLSAVVIKVQFVLIIYHFSFVCRGKIKSDISLSLTLSRYFSLLFSHTSMAIGCIFKLNSNLQILLCKLWIYLRIVSLLLCY